MTKHVIVISANGGIGGAVTRGFIDAGHVVTATVSRPEKRDAFAREFPGSRHVIALDLGDATRLKGELRALIDGMPRLDGIIVCGAVSPFSPLETTTLEDFREVMEINAVSHLAIYQAALPALRRDGGRLIFTGSLSGCVGTPMQGAYVASKFALEGMVDVMRREASAWGVAIVLLQPGYTATPAIARAELSMATALVDMSGEERTLYGSLYEKTHRLVQGAMENPDVTRPEVVAAVALEALESENPSPRYRIGNDAEFLIGMARTKTDREMDSFVLHMYQPQ